MIENGLRTRFERTAHINITNERILDELGAPHLPTKKEPMLGVRLDSGDLAQLSIEIRRLLDAAGFKNAKIMASNELDEKIIRDLKKQGAQINLWGVGTNLITAKDQPALDGVYKLSAIQNDQGEWVSKLKVS